jgi:hypothetical protein
VGGGVGGFLGGRGERRREEEMMGGSEGNMLGRLSTDLVLQGKLAGRFDGILFASERI